MISSKTLEKLQESLDPLEYIELENLIMAAAFSLVAPADDWRGPIDKFVPFHALGPLDPSLVAQAVLGTTWTEPSVERLEGGYRVKAAGQRAGEAAAKARAAK